MDAKRARLAKLRGTPGVREERVAEAERDLGDAQQRAEAAKATYEVRAVVAVLHRPGAAQVDGMLVATAVGARFAGVGALAIAVLSSLGPLQASPKLAILLPHPHPLHPSLLPQTIVQRMGLELDRFQRERAQEMGWVTPNLAAGVLQQVSSAVAASIEPEAWVHARCGGNGSLRHTTRDSSPTRPRPRLPQLRAARLCTGGGAPGRGHRPRLGVAGAWRPAFRGIDPALYCCEAAAASSVTHDRPATPMYPTPVFQCLHLLTLHCCTAPSRMLCCAKPCIPASPPQAPLCSACFSLPLLRASLLRALQVTHGFLLFSGGRGRGKSRAAVQNGPHRQARQN